MTGTRRQILLDTFNFAPSIRSLAGQPHVNWRMRNFGDELNPWLCTRLVNNLRVSHVQMPDAQAVVLGSVMERAISEGNPGTAVLGAGLVAPSRLSRRERNSAHQLRYYLVRGPLTRDCLGLAKSLPLGDPGLAVGQWARRLSDDVTTLLVHFRYARGARWRQRLTFFSRELGWNVVTTTESPDTVVDAISRSRVVFSTSLHGVIIADSLGVPALPVTLGPPRNDFRFDDYHASLHLDGIPLRSLEGAHYPSLFAAAERRRGDLGNRPAELGREVSALLLAELTRLSMPCETPQEA